MLRVGGAAGARGGWSWRRRRRLRRLQINSRAVGPASTTNANLDMSASLVLVALQSQEPSVIIGVMAPASDFSVLGELADHLEDTQGANRPLEK